MHVILAYRTIYKARAQCVMAQWAPSQNMENMWKSGKLWVTNSLGWPQAALRRRRMEPTVTETIG